jgi:Tfp pilus assembly protein PilX
MSYLRRTSEQSGQALVSAMIILAVITMLGFVAIQYAIVQNHQTGRERTGEAAFNFAESALDAEVSLLGKTWPHSSATAYPVCTQASTASSTCPAGSLAAGFTSSYAGSGFSSPTWSVQVVDDDDSGVADSNYYSDAILNASALAHWDSNTDSKLWVRASATLGGVTKTVVAEVVRQSYTVWLPQNVITAGGVQTENNGNKVIIEATDPGSKLTGSVDLRCGSSTTTPSYGSYCAGWDPKHGQLDPFSDFTTNYSDPLASYQTLTSGQLQALQQEAQENGTYYAAGTCPAEFTTGVIYIANANCSYSGGGNGKNTWNSASAPGAIIVAQGTLSLNAVNFYGVIYMANQQGTIPASGPCTTTQQDQVFSIQGSGTLYGGLFVDRCGVAYAGDSAANVEYDVKSFSGLSTHAVPSVALSTFRVLNNST